MPRRWLPMLLCCVVVVALPFPVEELESEDSRRVLGSSVVTSVSVIMDLGNGTQKYFADAAGRPVPKPTVAALVGSPAQLLNPDRYEFYTFAESGDLVKRLMTLDEIQSIIANGEGDFPDAQPLQSKPNYYHQKLPPDEMAVLSDKTEEETEAMDIGELSSSLPGVQDVVFSVQNVLKGELAKNKLKPPKPVAAPLPPSTVSSPDSSWSMIIPTIVSNSAPDGANVSATTVQPQKSSTVPAEHSSSAASSITTSTVQPQKSSTVPAAGSAERTSPVSSNVRTTTAEPQKFSAVPAAASTERTSPVSSNAAEPQKSSIVPATASTERISPVSSNAAEPLKSSIIPATASTERISPVSSIVRTTTAEPQKFSIIPATASTERISPVSSIVRTTTAEPQKFSIIPATASTERTSPVSSIVRTTTAEPQKSSTVPAASTERTSPVASNVRITTAEPQKSSIVPATSTERISPVSTNVRTTTAEPQKSSISSITASVERTSSVASNIRITTAEPQKSSIVSATASVEQTSTVDSNVITTTVQPQKSSIVSVAASAEQSSPVANIVRNTTEKPYKSSTVAVTSIERTSPVASTVHTTTVKPFKSSTVAVTSIETISPVASNVHATTVQPQKSTTVSVAASAERISPVTNNVRNTPAQPQKFSTVPAAASSEQAPSVTSTVKPYKSSAAAAAAETTSPSASNVVNGQDAVRNATSSDSTVLNTSEQSGQESNDEVTTGADSPSSTETVLVIIRLPNKTQEEAITTSPSSSTQQSVAKLPTIHTLPLVITTTHTTSGSSPTTEIENLINQSDMLPLSAVIAQLSDDSQKVPAAQEFIGLHAPSGFASSFLNTVSSLETEESKIGNAFIKTSTQELPTTTTSEVLKNSAAVSLNANSDEITTTTTPKSTTRTTSIPAITTKKPLGTSADHITSNIASLTKGPIASSESLSSPTTSFATTVGPVSSSSKVPAQNTNTPPAVQVPTTSHVHSSSDGTENLDKLKTESLRIPALPSIATIISETSEPEKFVLNNTSDLAPAKTDSPLATADEFSNSDMDVLAELAESLSSVLSQVGGSVTTIDYEEELLLMGNSPIINGSKVDNSEHVITDTTPPFKASTTHPSATHIPLSSSDPAEKLSLSANTPILKNISTNNINSNTNISGNNSSTELPFSLEEQTTVTEESLNITTITSISNPTKPEELDQKSTGAKDENNLVNTAITTTKSELYESTTTIATASEDFKENNTSIGEEITHTKEQQKTSESNEDNETAKPPTENLTNEVAVASPSYNHAILKVGIGTSKIPEENSEEITENEYEIKKTAFDSYQTTTNSVSCSEENEEENVPTIKTGSKEEEIESGSLEDGKESHEFFETTTYRQFITETTEKDLDLETTEKIAVMSVKDNAEEPLNNYKKTDIDVPEQLEVTSDSHVTEFSLTYQTTTLDYDNIAITTTEKDHPGKQSSTEEIVNKTSESSTSTITTVEAESTDATVDITTKVEEQNTDNTFTTLSTPVNKDSTAAVASSQKTSTVKEGLQYGGVTTWVKITSSEVSENRPLTSTTPLTEEIPPPMELLKFGATAEDKLENKVQLQPAPQESLGLEVTSSQLGEDVRRFADLCNELAFRLWVSLSGKGLATMSSRSLILSPFAITSLLAMVFLGARGPTSGQMNDILRLDDMVTFNPHLVFRNVTESVALSKNSGVATAAFVRELYSDRTKGKLLDFYKERAQQFYDGHVEEVNFATIGDLVRRRTNLLIKRQTHGKIAEYLHGNNIILRPPLAVFSANIFQTDCSGASTEGRDGEMYFTVTPAMRQRRLVPVPAAVWRSGFLAGYEPGLDATAVSLGDQESQVSVILVLPGQQGQLAPGDGLARLETRLLESSYRRRGAWSRLLRSLVVRPGLELQLPRFSHRSLLNVTSALQRMGLRDLFSAERADLRGINGLANDLHISDIVQVNTFCTCADEGGIGSRHHVEVFPSSTQRSGRLEDHARKLDADDMSSLPLALRPRQARLPDSTARLRFDRPFLYFVRHNPTGLILHMGRFNPRIRH